MIATPKTPSLKASNRSDPKNSRGAEEGIVRATGFEHYGEMGGFLLRSFGMITLNRGADAPFPIAKWRPLATTPACLPRHTRESAAMYGG